MEGVRTYDEYTVQPTFETVYGAAADNQDIVLVNLHLNYPRIRVS